MLIPKGDGKDFQCIVLVEVLWNTTTGIINRRLILAIQYPNSLYVFRTGRGTGTATPEADLLHHLTAMREVVLHTILLDLQKAYVALDREW